MPAPTPPGAAQPTAPSRCSASSGCSRRLRRRRRTAPPGTSLVGWVTGPDSPNDTIGRFAITGTDLGIMWDNGDPGGHQVLMAFGDTYGYCSVRGQQWRYNTLFRSQDGALSNTISVPNGVVSNQYSGSPLWAPGPFQTDHQQHQVGAIGDGNHSHRRHLRRGKPVPQLHVHQELGRQRRMDDELLGDRRVSRQRRTLGRLPRIRPRGPTGRRPGSPVRSGK